MRLDGFIFTNLHLENDTAVDEEKPRVPKGSLEV